MKSGLVDIQKLKRHQSGLEFKTAWSDGWIALLKNAGVPFPAICNTSNGHILTPPGMLEALRHMREQSAPAPSGIVVTGDVWSIPVYGVTVHPERENLITLALCGGVDRTLIPGVKDRSLIDELMRIAEIAPDLIPAAGIHPDDFLTVLDAIASPDDLLQDEQGGVDTDYGIPSLDLKWQATEVTAPFIKWGSRQRNAKAPGATFHFYTDDYKFTALASNPALLVDTGVSCAVEPNFSVDKAMPLAVVLYRTWQKRTMSLMWGEAGVKLFVDLNVDRRFFELNMIGVPAGWSAYCNRAYARDPGHLMEAYSVARARRGAGDLLYVVYGGGKRVGDYCAQNGWVWMPEQADMVRGRMTDRQDDNGQT